MPFNLAQNLKRCEEMVSIIVTTTELFFNNLGFKVASHPWMTIGLCWISVFITSLGFLKFHQEKNPFKLWVPPKSDFTFNTEWLTNKFENAYRTEGFIVLADDILTSDVLVQVADIDRRIKSIVTPEGITLKDVCFKIPEIDMDVNFLFNLMNPREQHNESYIDPSVLFNAATYCKFVESFDWQCLEKNILELWKFNENEIAVLTKEEIVNTIISNPADHLFGDIKNYTDLLGGIQRNETGHIISAKALHVFYMLHVNFSAIDMGKYGNMAGTADWIIIS